MRTRFLHVLWIGATLAIAGCGDSKEGSGASGQSQITAADRKAADEIFSQRCTTCHGPRGAGDGPGSKGLVPQPRNFQNPEWQASVTDEHIEKIIVGGGLAVGKAATMPPNPDLQSRPGVVAALREHVRDLAENKQN